MARAKGTGSVFDRPRGSGRWCYQVDVGFTPTGNRRRITKTGFPSKRAAEKALAATLRERARNGVPQISAHATVKAWAQEWLGQYAKHVRPSTYQSSASAVRNHIIPSIGKRQLTQLTPGDVRKVHASALAGGNSTSTALRAHAVLVTMLKAARIEGHAVPGNVFDVRRPTKAASDRDEIPTPDAHALLAAALDRGEDARWRAALLEGMRPSECLGLRWSAIDFDRGRIDVSWQLKPLPYADRAADTFRIPDGYEVKRLTGAYHLVRPKTAKGQRIVPLVPWLAESLLRWYEVCPTNPWGLVWSEGDRPMRDKTDRAAWVALQDAAQVARVDPESQQGRRYGLYEARHTTATLLLREGVDPAIIQAILGHSNIVTTRGYQHVDTDMARAALESATRVLSAPPGAASSPAPGAPAPDGQ